MRSQQRIQTVVSEIPLKRDKSNFLENDVTVRIGEDLFFHPVSSVELCIRQRVNGNAGFEGQVLEPAMTLLFREIIDTVGDK